MSFFFKSVIILFFGIKVSQCCEVRHDSTFVYYSYSTVPVNNEILSIYKYLKDTVNIDTTLHIVITIFVKKFGSENYMINIRDKVCQSTIDFFNEKKIFHKIKAECFLTEEPLNIEDWKYLYLFRLYHK